MQQKHLPGAHYDAPLLGVGALDKERSASLERLDFFVPKAFGSPAGEAKSWLRAFNMI